MIKDLLYTASILHSPSQGDFYNGSIEKEDPENEDPKT